MTHERDGRGDEATHEFSCDYPGCNETYVGDGDFRDVWDEARDDGWRCFENDGGEFEHRCPEHVGLD